MNVRILCLGILNAAPTSGYEIRKLVAEGTLAHFAEASYGSIYPALDKLEADGLVTSHEERDPGKPTRRVFTITPVGRAAFITAIHQMPGEDVFRSPFLLIAASASLVDPMHISRVIDARLAWCRAELARMEQERTQCPNDLADKEGWLWTLEYGIEMYRTSIRWLEMNRARLERIAGTAAAAEPTHSAASTASTAIKSAPVAPGE